MSNFTRRLESYPIPIAAFLYAFLQYKNKMENKEITRYYITQLKVLDSSSTRCPRDSSKIPIFTMGDTSLGSRTQAFDSYHRRERRLLFYQKFIMFMTHTWSAPP